MLVEKGVGDDEITISEISLIRIKIIRILNLIRHLKGLEDFTFDKHDKLSKQQILVLIDKKIKIICC